MSETKNEVYQPMTFDAIKIGLASPEFQNSELLEKFHALDFQNPVFFSRIQNHFF